VAELRGSDLRTVERQLGRVPSTDFSVIARCSPAGPGGAGHPLVIRNHPVDRGGNPFPTLYWLTCPDAVRAVSRLESEGWIKRLADRAERDPELGEALDAAHRSYAEERGRVVREAAAWGGVGGVRAGVKCLHAQYANHLAGGADPVGAWVAERVEPIHPETPGRERVAAVDMGTNSIRVLVAERSDGGPLDLARDLVITRLGLGIDRTGRLDPQAVRRTIEVLERYVRRARALGAGRIRVGATSAVRDAADRRSLDEQVARVVGESAEVLTGEREAELSFLGATSDLDPARPALVFDIGGGSTELVVGGARPEAAASVDLGSVRVTERVGPADPPSSDDLERMRAFASESLGAAEGAIPWGRAASLVGVAGTTTTVQSLALGLARYDPEVLHGSVLAREGAERVLRELAAMTIAERAALPVMTPGREDVIVAGAVILVEILRRWGFDECVVSERDILDGLAIEMLGSV
jgi:exopolyphosphatase / guanosine-5'-triphosphate,3'-diphosphate pyrophosphatase